jgi:hypothetical protein
MRPTAPRPTPNTKRAEPTPAAPRPTPPVAAAPVPAPALPATVPALANPRDLALIRRTVARDTTDDEFALFIHWARALRLDPLRRQVHAIVFNDPRKRRLSLVTSIEGVRAVAARTGNYRPDETAPTFSFDEARRNEANPAGLVSAAVRVWQ